MGTMKTPGVYIVEKDAFPNSVVEVATAVPAFIGYTEKAELGQKSLLNKPMRISSMAQFITYFGGPPQPKFVLKAVTQTSTPPAPAAGAGGGNPPAAAPAEDKSPRSKPIVLTIDSQNYELARSKFSPAYNLYRSLELFFNNQGGVCYIVSVGSFKKGADAVGAIDKSELEAGIKTLIKEQEPTMLVIPEAVSLDSQADCAGLQNLMVTHCGTKMKNRIAILDVYGGTEAEVDNNCISKFRASITADNLDFASAYYPWINTSLVNINMLTFDNFSSESGEDKKEGRSKVLDLIEAEFKAIKDAALPDNKASAEEMFKTRQALIADAKKGGTAQRSISAISKSLRAYSNIYKSLLEELKTALNVMPTSAAMAGVYTRTDNNIGVWQAPANRSIVGMVSPTVELSNEDQSTLNVDVDGKSINAFRTFSRGPTIWGARTLDGNSLDWRYVNVRRTMIMLEQSIKLAADAFVFEPNTGQTWVTMRSMINNFLTGIWKRGGLVGAVPEEAFVVKVGLGETMEPEDILEGILRISVHVAIARPAEFIEITFQQQMQKS